MNAKPFIGAVVSGAYNNCISYIPSRSLRKYYLRYALGELGVGTSIQTRCRFLNPRRVKLGKNNVINFGCLLDGRRFFIQTGANVSIGPEAAILTLGHDPQSAVFADRGGDVIIGDRVWVGYRAILLPGITIGEGAVVGAGTVVTSDVEPYTIVVGNPARKVGNRNANLTYHLAFDPFLG
jgi:acetyltransferase-like isoleucine patch superfamily enzyme